MNLSLEKEKMLKQLNIKLAVLILLIDFLSNVIIFF